MSQWAVTPARPIIVSLLSLVVLLVAWKKKKIRRRKKHAAKSYPKWVTPMLDQFCLRFGFDVEGGRALLEGNFSWRQSEIRQKSSLAPGAAVPRMALPSLWECQCSVVRKRGRRKEGRNNLRDVQQNCYDPLHFFRTFKR